MILTVIQIILAISLIVIILFQGKGGILSQKWAGKSFRSKRGVEKILFMATIVLAILFLISSIITIIIK